jgi:hypothetical protein
LFDTVGLELEDDDEDTQASHNTTMNNNSDNFITILTSLLDSTVSYASSFLSS